MIVSYVRQTAEFSPFDYLSGPHDFDNRPADMTCFKNIIFLLNPDETEQRLYIRSVGYEESDPVKALINRYYSNSSIIHYIVGGEGTFNGKPIHAGDCAVAFRDHRHSLCANPDNPLKFYWIMIRSNSEFDLEQYGFQKNVDVFPYSFEKEIRSIFHDMLYSSYADRDAHCFFLSKMYELLSLHRRKAVAEDISTRHSNSVLLAKRMWEQTAYSLSVADVAKSLGFSRKHFSAIFLKETGFLPQRYILEHKIQIARSRIEMNDDNFKLMAFQLGYKDYPSFSRAFKHVIGKGPREYYAEARRIERSENN